jgi:hypothetical protein
MNQTKRFDGEITVYYPDDHWGFLRTQSGDRLFFHERDVRGDWRGSTAWVRIQGTPVTFTVKHKASKKYSGQIFAAADDVAPVFQDPPTESLETYREVSRVREWNGCFGNLTRECGSVLFFHRSALIQGRPSDVKVGDFLYHGVRQREDGRFGATAIQLYSHVEQDRLQRGLPAYEVEPEEEPESAVSELLTPANRNKTIHELIEEKRRAC